MDRTRVTETAAAAIALASERRQTAGGAQSTSDYQERCHSHSASTPLSCVSETL